MPLKDLKEFIMPHENMQKDKSSYKEREKESTLGSFFTILGSPKAFNSGEIILKDVFLYVKGKEDPFAELSRCKFHCKRTETEYSMDRMLV